MWKSTGLRLREGELFLGSRRGLQPKAVKLPSDLIDLPMEAFARVKLVWDQRTRRYFWHIDVDDGLKPAKSPGSNIAALDLGEIHPVVATDGQEAVVFSARELRSAHQYTNKRLAELRSKQDRLTKGSRMWKRLQRRKNRFLGEQNNRIHDIEHKVSRSVVNWAVGRQVGTLVIGDVRNVASGKRLNRVAQQKIGNWTHGRLRRQISYKAEASGIQTELIGEQYTSQTCPQCGSRYKPKGRVYHCPACGFEGHRDVVGAANILSKFTLGEVGKIWPTEIKYHRPFIKADRCSRSDTAQVACLEQESERKCPAIWRLEVIPLDNL